MIFSPQAHSQNANSEATFRFLNLTGSARMAGLGGNHVSLPFPDATMFISNPAYLGSGNHKELSASYMNHIGDLSMGVSSFAFDHEKIGTMAVSARYFGYGDIPHTNSFGEDLGTFNASDFALNTGLSRSIFPRLQAGLALQFIYSSYHEYSASGIALSAGLFYTFSDDLTWAGFSISNMGQQISTFDEQREPLPLDIRASVTRRLQHLPLRLSLTAYNLHVWELPSLVDEQSPGFFDHLFRHFILGGEFLFSDNFNLRLGYNHYLHEELRSDRRIDLGGASIGVGVTIRGFTFDVGRNSYSNLGGITQIGVRYQL